MSKARKQQDKLVITLNGEKREYQKKEDVTFISIFVVGCHIFIHKKIIRDSFIVTLKIVIKLIRW